MPRHRWTEADHRFALKTYLDELEGHMHIGRANVIETIRKKITRPGDGDLTASISMLLGHMSYILQNHGLRYWDTFTPLPKEPGTLEDRVVAYLEDNDYI